MVKRRNIKPSFQVIENKEGFLPYSTGKRACPGAKLADMQLFLVLTNILAEYTLSLPKGDKGELGTQFKVKKTSSVRSKLYNHIIQAGTAVLRNPKPYRVVVQARA